MLIARNVVSTQNHTETTHDKMRLAHGCIESTREIFIVQEETSRKEDIGIKTTVP
jgi:hypothetical protein